MLATSAKRANQRSAPTLGSIMCTGNLPEVSRQCPRWALPLSLIRSGLASLGRLHGTCGRCSRVARRLAHVPLHVTGVVAVEEGADQAAVQVRGAEQPVHDREGEV